MCQNKEFVYINNFFSSINISCLILYKLDLQVEDLECKDGLITSFHVPYKAMMLANQLLDKSFVKMSMPFLPILKGPIDRL